MAICRIHLHSDTRASLYCSGGSISVTVFSFSCVDDSQPAYVSHETLWNLQQKWTSLGSMKARSVQCLGKTNTS